MPVSQNIKSAMSANGDAPVFGCRAWVNFKGTGVVSIRSAGNVSSILDQGIGNYTINFLKNMPHDLYAVIGNAAGSMSGGMVTSICVLAEAISNTINGSTYIQKTTSQVRIMSADNNSDTLIDTFSANVSIFC